MANILFKRGLQAKLPTTEAIDGAFYLTTDTHRLYVGNSEKKLDLLSQAVVTVDNLADLNSSTGNYVNTKVEGQFYYSKNENVLCVYTGNAYKQINPDTFSEVKSNTLHLSSDTDGVAKISTNLQQKKNTDSINTPVADDSPIKMIGSGSASVSIDASSKTITINSKVYTLSVAQSETQGKVNLSLNDGGENSSVDIGFSSGKNVTVAAKDNETLEISAIDHDINEITIGPVVNNGNGFGVVVASTTGDIDLSTSKPMNSTVKSAILDPIVSVGYGDAKQDIHFVNGTATLPVYTKTEIDSKDRALDALVYMGAINSGSEFTSLIAEDTTKIGDTYKVSTFFSIGSESFHVNDLVIFRGKDNAKEEEDGYLSIENIAYDIIHSGDGSDTTYKFASVTTTDKAIISLTEKVGGIPQNSIILQGDDYINIANVATDSNNGQDSAITVTHKAPSEDTSSEGSGLVQPYGVVQEAGKGFSIITGVNLNDTGHVTGLVTDELRLRDTTIASDENNGITLGETLSVSEDKNVVTTNSLIVIKDTSGARFNSSFTKKYKSDTLTLDCVNDPQTGETKAISFDLTWGEF